MNTLHLCHWQNRQHFNEHLSLMSKLDTLVIYGSIGTEDISWIRQNSLLQNHAWHLVKDQQRPQNSHYPEISNKQWLTMIIKHKNTLAWK